MRLQATTLKKSDIAGAIKGVVFSALVCVSLSMQASESKPPYDERLIPLAQAFLGLQLCATYATEQEQDLAKGDKYSQVAWSLYDRTLAIGWSEQLFSAAMVVAHERRSLLEVKDDDTPASFKRRHQSGQPCEDKVATAQAYLVDGIPKPL